MNLLTCTRNLIEPGQKIPVCSVDDLYALLAYAGYIYRERGQLSYSPRKVE